MQQKRNTDAVGFPPPLMGEAPLRLQVLAEGEDWLVLEKPAGVAVREHPWYAGQPNLDEALNLQLQAGKPELKRRGASLFGSVYFLDPELAGVALFAKNRQGVASLRDGFGSERFEFYARFVTGHAADADELVSDAPLLPHRTKPKMIPSTAKGKKSQTTFRKLASGAASFALWEARARFLRPHQIRAHAAVAGIPVLGDALYGGAEIPMLGELERKKRGPGLHKPVFEGLPLVLQGLSVTSEAHPDSGFSGVEMETPAAFDLLLRRLGLKA